MQKDEGTKARLKPGYVLVKARDVLRRVEALGVAQSDHFDDVPGVCISEV